jgi:hypothetical protein
LFSHSPSRSYKNRKLGAKKKKIARRDRRHSFVRSFAKDEKKTTSIDRRFDKKEKKETQETHRHGDHRFTSRPHQQQKQHRDRIQLEIRDIDRWQRRSAMLRIRESPGSNPRFRETRGPKNNVYAPNDNNDNNNRNDTMNWYADLLPFCSLFFARKRITHLPAPCFPLSASLPSLFFSVPLIFSFKNKKKHIRIASHRIRRFV